MNGDAPPPVDAPAPVERPLSISTIGHHSLTSKDDKIDPDSPVTLSWIDIRYSVTPPKPTLWTRLFRPAKYRTWKAKEPHEILHGVLGEIRPGEMIAIMGGSGAGKTTMLNILAGKVSVGHPSGVVIVNGARRDPKVWPFIKSFVEQEDILDENLTVSEFLRFGVDMRNKLAEFTVAQKDAKVTKLMKAMGLTRLANRKIGSPSSKDGISGGERKRVSIAFELAAERRVLFLDEPTTGLDAGTSAELLETIGTLSRVHMLSVICCIHQPSAKMLQKFDKILLLSLGRTIFFGSLPEITDHLNEHGFYCPEQENPADWILDVISVDNSNGGVNRQESLERISRLHTAWEVIEAANTGEFHRRTASLSQSTRARSWAARMTASVRSFVSTHSAEDPRTARRSVTSLFLPHRQPRVKPEEISHWPHNRLTEFFFLLRRYVLIETRNHATNMFLFFEFLLLSIILGFVYFRLTRENFGGFQSRVGLFATIPALIITLISVELMVLFTNKRKLIIRERFGHLYRLSDAYVANVLALIPVRLVSVILFGTIMYYLTGLRTDSFTYFLVYIGFVCLIGLFAIFFGIAIAAASVGSLMAAVVRSIFIYIFILFAGNLARTSDVTPIISWMRFLSPYFYALQGLLQNECVGIEIAGEPGTYWVDLYDLGQFSVMWNAGALMIMCGATFVIGYVGLSLTTRPRYIII